MAVKIRRSYKGASIAAVLDSSGVSSATQTSITLSTSPSTWPTGKFFVVVAPGTAQEEKMCVTLSGSTLTVVDPAVTSTSASANGRGVDNTTARSTIAGGSTVYPVFTAVDADEANELTSTYSAQGHIVYQGASTFTGLGIGTAGQVLKVNAGATAPEWGQVPTAGLADNSVTSAKIVNGTIVLEDLAAALQAFLVPVGTITAYSGAAAPTGWLLCDGTAISGSYTSLIALVGANTPDLRGRFPMGKTASGTGSTLLGTGGSTTIAEGNLPSHSHGAGTLAVTSSGAHTHSGTTDSDGAHFHEVGFDVELMINASDSLANEPNGTSPSTYSTSTAGSHSHTFSISSSGAHTHTVTGTSGSTGSGTAYFQPFVAVNYIIKHD